MLPQFVLVNIIPLTAPFLSVMESMKIETVYSTPTAAGLLSAKKSIVSGKVFILTAS